jgi:hypothetical protein
VWHEASRRLCEDANCQALGCFLLCKQENAQKHLNKAKVDAPNHYIIAVKLLGNALCGVLD